jgi:hypothetical protein
MRVIGWGKRAETGRTLQDECVELATSLEGRFTRKTAKQKAAALLRNVASEGRTICRFCGGGREDVLRLLESPFDSRVLICEECTRSALQQFERLRQVSARVGDDGSGEQAELCEQHQAIAPPATT